MNQDKDDMIRVVHSSHQLYDSLIQYIDSGSLLYCKNQNSQINSFAVDSLSVSLIDSLIETYSLISMGYKGKRYAFVNSTVSFYRDDTIIIHKSFNNYSIALQDIDYHVAVETKNPGCEQISSFIASEVPIINLKCARNLGHVEIEIVLNGSHSENKSFVLQWQ